MTQSLDILDRLIGFNTVSDRSNLELITYVQSFLNDLGYRTTRLGDASETKAGLYAEHGPAGPGVLLSAHSDVVPVEGQNWRAPPFRLTMENDRLYGRGTTDMKGFLAEMLAFAARGIDQPLKEPLKLVVSYDEEVGCLGMSQMQDRLRQLIGVPQIAIVGEPTEMRVAVGHKGKRAYRALVRGQAGHSALAPKFTNALYVATDFVQALRGLQSRLKRCGAQDAAYDIPYSTVHVGKMTGGRALNIVPDEATLEFEFRHLKQDNPDALAAEIAQCIDEAVRKVAPDASIDLDLLSAYPGLDVAEDSHVVALAQRLTGTETCKVAFGTEAGFFSELGVPTVVCGPGSMSGQGHKADEYVERAQLKACEKMLDKALAHLT